MMKKNCIQKLNENLYCHDIQSDKPIIGLTGNFTEGNCLLGEPYIKSIVEAQGIPLIIPPLMDETMLPALLDTLDGIVLTGGADINPLYFNEEPITQLGDINFWRDRQELQIAQLAYNRQLPILGICRGIQIMNVAFGGTLYQDINIQHPAKVKHSQNAARWETTHSVTIEQESLLNNLLGETEIAVNSFHHQAVKEVAPGFVITARAVDGIIEAIESSEHKPMLGVQWHPESFIMNNDRYMMPVFDWLICESKCFRHVKLLHTRIISLDTHCDTPMFFEKGVDFGIRDSRIKVDLHKMAEGHLDAVIMAAYIPQGDLNEESHKKATDKANDLIDKIELLANRHNDHIGIAYKPADLIHLKQIGKKAIMIGIENGYAFGNDLKNIQRFRNRGVVYTTLCHNGNNLVCGSAIRNDNKMGITPFGEQVIQEMNRLGMMVDISHAGERSFYEALEISQSPIVASHSSAKALCNHPRNLTDEQIIALARKGGVIQVTLYPGFLNTNGQANIEDVIRHINHVVKLVSINHVGIGTDFDGDGGVYGCDSASELINITRHLLRNRYSDNDLSLIWGGNFLRVMTDIQNHLS